MNLKMLTASFPKKLHNMKYVNYDTIFFKACTPARVLACEGDNNQSSHNVPGFCYSNNQNQWTTDSYTDEQSK